MPKAPEPAAAFYLMFYLRNKGALTTAQLLRFTRIRTYVGCCEDSIIETAGYLVKRGFVAQCNGKWTLTDAGRTRLEVAQWFDVLDSRVSHKRIIGLGDEPTDKTPRRK